MNAQTPTPKRNALICLKCVEIFVAIADSVLYLWRFVYKKNNNTHEYTIGRHYETRAPE